MREQISGSGVEMSTWRKRSRVASDRAPECGRVWDRRPELHQRIANGQRLCARGRAVYQTYTTTWRGLEFIMGYYPILDRAPKGRDEARRLADLASRHDEYGRSGPTVT